jgi:TetR/AcrR family transcriptional repressor of nem operon
MSKGEETRKRIIAKAAPLFNKRGFDGASMQDIVAAAGLQKGSLYGHFASKEELALEAFDLAWAETCKARAGNLDEAANSVDKLKLHVENVVTQRPFPGGCPLLNTAIDADDGDAALRRRAQKALQSWNGLLRAIVQDGKDKGEIKSEVDPEYVASLIISLLEGASFSSQLERTGRALLIAQKHLNAYLEDEVRAAG